MYMLSDQVGRNITSTYTILTVFSLLCFQKKRSVRDESLAAVPGVAEIDLSVPLHVPGMSASLSGGPFLILWYALSAYVVSCGADLSLQSYAF